jgi:predicted DCC family thiol-disulfide oxidoreductase YuxK
VIGDALNWLADEPRHRRGVRVLQAAVGAVVLFRVLTELPFAAYFWGPHGIGLSGSGQYFGVTLGARLDALFHTMSGTYALLALLGLGAFGLLTGTSTRAATALVLVTTLMFERRLPEILDGGDNITRLVLVYMLFLLPARARVVRQSTAVWLHNLAVVAIIAQLIILYGTSGIMKAAGERWHHGTALYVISQVEWFSEPWMRTLFKNAYLVTLATYATLLFQLWFPMAVFSRFKLLWLAAGIFFHLGIATGMGLVTFSTVMIGLELFLITDEEYDAIGARLRRLAGGPGLVLFIDGHCPRCVEIGATLRRLDFGRRLTIHSFRHDDAYRAYGLSLEALERRMHVTSPTAGSVDGFAAVRLVARSLPPLWPLRPLLWLLAALGLGDRAYDALARRRRLVPDAHACRDGACARPESAPATKVA